MRGGAEQVRQTRGKLTRGIERGEQKRPAKRLGVNGFWWRPGQVRMLQPSREQWFQAPALDRLLAARVGRFLATRAVIHESIEQLIARPGLEADRRRNFGGWWHKQDGSRCAQVNEKSRLRW